MILSARRQIATRQRVALVDKMPGLIPKLTLAF